MTHTVWFLTLPGVMALDLTGPAETLKLAGEHFMLRYIGPQPEVVCSTGMTIGGIEPLPDQLPAGSLLVVPGVYDSQVCYATPQAGEAREWLMRQHGALRAQTLCWSASARERCWRRRQACWMTCSAPPIMM